MPLVIAAWRSSDHARDLAAQEQCRSAGACLLLCRPASGRYVLGPFVQPGVAGCADCARRRREAAAGPDHPGPGTLPSPAPWEDIARRGLLALARRYHTGDLAELWCRVWEIDAGGPGRLRRHQFLPVPACRYCGCASEDEPVTFSVAPCPMPDPRALRLRSVAALHHVRAATVDARYGVIRQVSVVRSLAGRPAVAVPAAKSGHELVGVGRDADEEVAKTTAVLEALERLAGSPGQRRPAAHGSFPRLPAQALDPATVAQHQPEAYGQPDPALRPFAPENELSWTWAYSFTRGQLLVPEQLAYHLLPERSRDELCWQETSSGCATGSCLQEAVLHGLLEVIERDAFLGCWYLRRVPRRLALPAAGPWRPALEQLHACGYGCDLFDITWDIDVPVVWALARRRPEPAPTPGHPAWSISGVCAHPDPYRAVGGALREVRSQLGVRDFAARPVPELAAMLSDPFLVRSPADHRHAHAIAEAGPRFAFVDGAPRVPVATAHPCWRRLIHADLAECLRALVTLVAGQGLEVIAVDQTTGEQRGLGLRTAKVIVPGTLPMTFGHANRRTRGVPRLSARATVPSGQELPHCLA